MWKCARRISSGAGAGPFGVRETTASHFHPPSSSHSSSRLGAAEIQPIIFECRELVICQGIVHTTSPIPFPSSWKFLVFCHFAIPLTLFFLYFCTSIQFGASDFCFALLLREPVVFDYIPKPPNVHLATAIATLLNGRNALLRLGAPAGQVQNGNGERKVGGGKSQMGREIRSRLRDKSRHR